MSTWQAGYRAGLESAVAATSDLVQEFEHLYAGHHAAGRDDSAARCAAVARATQRLCESISAIAVPQEPPPAPADGWRDIATAPKDGTPFLAYWKAPLWEHYEIVVAKYSSHLKNIYGVNVRSLDGQQTISSLDSGFAGRMTLHATHWQPEPAPPAKERGMTDPLWRAPQASESKSDRKRIPRLRLRHHS